MPQRFILVMLFLIAVSGCATTQDQSVVTQLQLRVGELERQLDEKDGQIRDLEYEVKDLSYDMGKIRSRVTKKQRTTLKGSAQQTKGNDDIIRVPVSVEDVQLALKRAGYYEGKVDGKLGVQTKAAITKFQKANGLKSDGVIGKKTWSELKDYAE